MARLTALDAIPISLTIGDYVDRQALRGSSKRHRTDIRRELLRFAATLDADLPIDQVTREHCIAYLRSFRERECNPNTLKAYHRIVGAFFRWCVEEERIDVSPMKRVPTPKDVQEQIKPLSAEELSALLGEPNRKSFAGLPGRRSDGAHGRHRPPYQRDTAGIPCACNGRSGTRRRR
jgi:site-specific recombinase XerD